MHRGVRIVGGSRNDVVESHPHVCHHCGFFGVPADRTCTTCGIMVHRQCVPWTHDDVCDACTDVHVRDGICELCLQPDDPTLPVHSVDRFCKKLVYHGRTFERQEETQVERTTQDETMSRLERRLSLDPTSVFRPWELPNGGKHPLTVTVDGVVYASKAMIVHSWCATCLFKTNFHADDWQEELVARLDSCPVLPWLHCAKPLDAVTLADPLQCGFCGSSQGVLGACMFHTNMKHGCKFCADDKHKRDTTTFAFHPSCAVVHGMQRIVRVGDIGMLCALHKDWRAIHKRSLKPWLGYQSGIHEELVGFQTVTAASLTDGVEERPKKGRRYDSR